MHCDLKLNGIGKVKGGSLTRFQRCSALELCSLSPPYSALLQFCNVQGCIMHVFSFVDTFPHAHQRLRQSMACLSPSFSLLSDCLFRSHFDQCFAPHVPFRFMAASALPCLACLPPNSTVVDDASCGKTIGQSEVGHRDPQRCPWGVQSRQSQARL